MPPVISTEKPPHFQPKTGPSLLLRSASSTSLSSGSVLSGSTSSTSLATTGSTLGGDNCAGVPGSVNKNRISDDRLPNSEASAQPNNNCSSLTKHPVNTSSPSTTSLSSLLLLSATGSKSHDCPSRIPQANMMKVQNPVAVPVGIPIKTSNINKLPPSLLEFGKKRHGSRSGRRTSGKENVPAAALKILAATSIPPRSNSTTSLNTLANHARSRPGNGRRRSSDVSPTSLDSPSSLLEFALNEALNEKASPITRSNSQTFLNVLLSPPDASDEFSFAASPSKSAFSIRSMSTDSIPSLANDDEGTFSWGQPLTPSPLRRSSRLNKTFSPPEDCLLDHPLLTSGILEQDFSSDEEIDPAAIYTEQVKKSGAFSKLSFKSNLTASLRVLRSAAKTFSSLSAPLAQPDDFLTRSILSISPQYNTDEKRPRYQDIPTPALRRYLNPSPKTFSRELGLLADRNESVSASIQLQTYKETVIAPPPEIPIPRNREVRENSDFLRVIVLEMNMRRQGKLSDTSQGKARFVLPPRQSTKLRTLGNRDHWKPLVYE